jgi:glycosyltransferase involved in cell wall biosynthesis
MRIGLIAPPWIPVPPTGYGGTEAVIDALANAFTAAGHSVLLAAAANSTCPVEQVAGCEAENRATLGETQSELPHIIRAYAAMTGADIIHDHTLAGPLYRHRPPGIPVVSTIHSPITPSLAEVYRTFSRDVALVAISHNQAGTAPQVNIRRVIHHGIDAAAVPVGTGAGGYVCFLGRMSPCKGVVEAITVARQAGMPLKLAVKMSERAELEYFRTVVEPLLGPDEEFLGELDPAGKAALLGGATALINPMQWDEPFGMVMIESLATGTPVVATPRGAAPEIIDPGTTGFLAPTIEGLAACLPHAAQLDRRSCRSAVETRFSAEAMARNYTELFTELLSDPVPAASAAR